MSRHSSMPDDDDWISAAQDLRSKSRGLAIAFAFYSPKNCSSVTLWGEAAFAHLILAEGDSEIFRYNAFRTKEIRAGRIRQVADIVFKNGALETWAFSHESPSIQNVELEGVTGPLKWKTAIELKGKEVRIWNWIRLRAFMDRIRGLSTLTEHHVIDEQLAQGRETTVRKLVNHPSVDYGLMLGEVASQLATGALYAELDDSHFSLLTSLRRR